ncbi:MAG: AMP-binding protein [Coxiellaceae bacterium]|nr:AMP-binding protein [Coxiellaceae bacterium]
MQQHFEAKQNWWYRQCGGDAKFSEVWQLVSQCYGDSVAYVTESGATSYQDILRIGETQQKKIAAKEKIICVDGAAEHWLAEAIAVWALDKAVLFFDGKVTDHPQIKMPQAVASKSPHAVFYTSGSTGTPKCVTRETAFALFEAASYLEDVQSADISVAVSLIKPWFGAMTKHTLAMLLAGIPQYFANNRLALSGEKPLLYCTPSQLANDCYANSQQWKMVSLTGEPINGFHLDALKKCLLKSNGVVLDSFGSTECGVIARRQLTADQLTKSRLKFSGDVLPGKTVTANAQGELTITLPNGKQVSTGDIGRIDGRRLLLYGRSSMIRKINGAWVDASPLLDLLRSRNEFYHVQLNAAQCVNGQLQVLILAKQRVIIDDIYMWLSEHLENLQLLPQIKLSYSSIILGHTGKAKGVANESAVIYSPPDYIQMIADMIVPINDEIKTRQRFMDVSFYQQGVDSLGIARLTVLLESRLSMPGLLPAILVTDTVKSIRHLLQDSCDADAIRQIATGENDKNIMFFGNSLAAIAKAHKLDANLFYNGSISHHRRAESLSTVAHRLYQHNKALFKASNGCWFVAYSIDTLLVAELCSVCEKNNISIAGIFLLDPPSIKRKRYLKKKYWWLKVRGRFMKYLLDHTRYNNNERYYYECRKMVIAKQPMKTVQSRVVLLKSEVNFAQRNTWPVQGSNLKQVELKSMDHFDLVKTTAGKAQWLSHLRDAIACQY